MTLTPAQKTFLLTTAQAAAKAIAMFFAAHGFIAGTSVEAWAGIIVFAMSYAYSIYNDQGRVVLAAAFDVMRWRILNEDAKIKAGTTMPAAAMSKLADHAGQVAPLASSPVPPVASAIALAIGLAALGLGWPGTAHAQINRQPAVRAAPVEAAATEPRTTTHGLPCDLLNLLPGCQIQSQDATGKTTTKAVELDLWKKITDAALPDLDYASALAAAAGTGASGVRKQCWDALTTANKQASGLGVKNADGTSRAKPDPSLFTDVESLAEVLDNLAPGGPLWTACAGAAQLAKTNVLTLLNAMVTGAAGMAALGVT